MNSNAGTAVGATEMRSDREFAFLDALPPMIRRQLNEANIVIAAEDAAALVAILGEHQAARVIRQDEMDELHEFNRAHWRRHGYHLPALSARVSILRGGYAF